jgi:zinc finger HIT domain-containing protein 1
VPTARSKQWSEKFKVIDSITRREAHEARLASLENENFIIEKELHASADDDGEYKPLEASNEDEGLVSLKKRRKRQRSEFFKTAARQMFRTFDEVLKAENYEAYCPHIPTYLTVAAPPSHKPPRHFCYVCGFEANYTCKRCGLRFCSLKCDETHKESRCLKFIQ